MTSLQQRKAFTLLELLVVISIIAILAALLMPVLSAAKKRAAQSACINNQKQLGLGMQMYLGDNRDIFPGIASGAYGFHREDWIYWRTNTIYPQFDQSPILTSIPGLEKPSLRCPLDISDADRLDVGLPQGPYLFSYSFNGYGLNSEKKNLGMSSVVDTSSGVTNKYLFTEGAVRNPSGKIMLAEEPGTIQSWDHPDIDVGVFQPDTVAADWQSRRPVDHPSWRAGRRDLCRRPCAAGHARIRLGHKQQPVRAIQLRLPQKCRSGRSKCTGDRRLFRWCEKSDEGVAASQR
jgi:prepilin-type N-terminal cleavage/methylation domain-containing protein